MQGIATVVEGSMTQGAGQEPVARTATLRDFRVPPYARVPVQGHALDPDPAFPEPVPAQAPAPVTAPVTAPVAERSQPAAPPRPADPPRPA
ncbi:hypothetical protein BU196_26765, partial [Streptomyces sp. CBMA370]|nr:hypothetical protein [Streptomyces sp. CBMA370]